MKQDDISGEVANILRETGDLLQGNPEEQATVLRQSVKKIKKLSEKSDNPHLVYLSYFLTLYVGDLWSNFAVDSAYAGDIEDDDVRKVLCRVGNGFARISKHLVARQYDKCYNVYLDLVYGYLKDVESIKRRIRGQAI